jgi:hypothetical protein
MQKTEDPLNYPFFEGETVRVRLRQIVAWV